MLRPHIVRVVLLFTASGLTPLWFGCGETSTSALVTVDAGKQADATRVPLGDSGGGDVIRRADGPCGGSCAITLAAGVGYPGGIVVDSKNVYWTDAQHGEGTSAGCVTQIPIGGGSPITLASGQKGPWGIAVSSTTVYWGNYNGGGQLASAPIDGGSVVVLTTDAGWAGGVALDAENVYWTSGGNGANNYVNKMLLDGGAPVVLASRPNIANWLAVGGADVYWTEMGETIIGQGTPGTDVMSVASLGGTPSTIASGQEQPGAIVTDATSVYWADEAEEGGPGSVMTAPLGGGAVVTLAGEQGDVSAIAVDDANVYYTVHDSGTVLKVPKGGGTPTTLLAGLTYPNAIAVDATNVYVATEGLGGALTGALLKISPK